jgi:hemerythrin
MITLAENMKVGVELIDIQHQELIDRLNTVTYMGTQSTSKEETLKTLNLLNEYVIKHFRDEEELQKSVEYPKYEEHRKLHQYYIEELYDLKKEFDTNGNSAKFTTDLSKSIIVWILRHIRLVDMEFGEYYKSKKI